MDNNTNTLKFFQLPNDFFRGKNDERGVTPVAVRLFCLLEELRAHYQRRVIASLDILSDFMRVRERDDRNKKRIKEALLELEQKNYISVDINGDLKNNSTLVITKPDKIEGGFTQVPLQYYFALTDVDEYALMCVMFKNKDWKRYQVSVDELADSIQCERKKATNVADALREKGFLLILDNGWYQTASGQVRKSMNTYKVKPGSTNSTGSAPTESRESEPEVSVAAKQPVENEQPREANFGRWASQDKDVFPEYEDYVLYRDNGDLDPEMAKRIERRISGMKNKGGKLLKKVSAWEDEYEREVKVRQEKQVKQKVESLIKEHEQVVVKLEDNTVIPYTTEVDFDKIVSIFARGYVPDRGVFFRGIVEVDVHNFEYTEKADVLRYTMDQFGDVYEWQAINVKHGRPVDYGKEEYEPDWSNPVFAEVRPQNQRGRSYKPPKVKGDISVLVDDEKPKSKETDDPLDPAYWDWDDDFLGA